MFETATFLLNGATLGDHPWGEEYRVSPAARRLYHRIRQQARLGRFVAELTGRQTAQHLMELNGFTGGRAGGDRHKAGFQTVPLCAIRSSLGRRDDFDAAFQPLQANTEQRWLRVATARQEGVGLPPVQLIRVGDTYFLVDGHHRVSVAKARGEVAIEAEVTVWDLD